jgi:hypothetical protein
VKLNVRSEGCYLLEVISAAYLAFEHKIVSILYDIDYLLRLFFERSDLTHLELMFED